MSKSKEADAPTKAEAKTWEQWAAERGHVAALPKPMLFGDRKVTHTGPDVRVVRAFFRWPVGKTLTAVEYDESVDLVYNKTALR